MTKNEIQEQRMKRYFIDAAKRYIKGEGVKTVTARNIANEAGYSYATIYNYFKDIKELIFVCASEFIQEIKEQIQLDTAKSEPGEQRIIAAAKSYWRYFMQYKGIFELMFLETINEISVNENICKAIDNFIDNEMENDWEIIAKEKGLNSDTKKMMMDAYKSTLNFYLLMYLNRRIPSSFADFEKDMNLRIKFILEK